MSSRGRGVGIFRSLSGGSLLALAARVSNSVQSSNAGTQKYALESDLCEEHAGGHAVEKDLW